MARYRNIETAYREIKEKDPGTCLTRYQLRKMVKNGAIPYKQNGSRYLIDLDKLEEYLQG